MTVAESSETPQTASKASKPSPSTTKMQSFTGSSSQPGQQYSSSSSQHPGQQFGQQFEQYRGKFQEQAEGGVDRLRNWLQGCIQNTSDTLRVYINQYPPLAAYLFSLIVLSAIPVSVYVLFAVITAAIVGSIALVAFAAVEGTMLMAGGGLLLAVLSGIGLFTTIGFSVLSAIYIGYRTFSMVFGRVWEGAGYMTSRVQEVGQRMQESMPQFGSDQQQQQQPSALGLSGGISAGGRAGTST